MKQRFLPGRNPPQMTVHLRDFSHGLDTGTAESLMPDGAAVDMNHCSVDNRVLTAAGGVTPIHGGALQAEVQSLMVFDDGDERRVYPVLSNGQMWNLQALPPYVVIFGMTDEPMSYVSYSNHGREVLIFGNKKSGLYEFNGVNIRKLDTAPNPNALILHKERLWILPADDPMAVQCCRDMDPEDWSQTLNSGALIKIMTWDGTRCIGLKSVFEDVIVAKERSLWRIWGSDPTNFQLSPVYSGRGSIANRSMAICDGGMAFLSQDGVFFYDGIRVRDLHSARIKRIIAEMDKTLCTKAAGIFFNGCYYLSLATGQEYINNTVLCYNFALGSWTVRRGININDWAILDDRLLCGTVQGFVAEYLQGETLLGVPYAAHWTGAMRGLDGLAVQKSVDSVTLTARGNGILQVCWTLDQNPGRFLSVVLTPEWRTQTLPLCGTGKMVRFGLRGTVGTTFEVADAAFTLSVL